MLMNKWYNVNEVKYVGLVTTILTSHLKEDIQSQLIYDLSVWYAEAIDNNNMEHWHTVYDSTKELFENFCKTN